MNGCPFLVEDCTMDGTDYDCEHPTYGEKYGCDRCPMFGRNGNKRQYRLVNFRAVSKLPFTDYSEVTPAEDEDRMRAGGL